MEDTSESVQPIMGGEEDGAPLVRAQVQVVRAQQVEEVPNGDVIVSVPSRPVSADMHSDDEC